MRKRRWQGYSERFKNMVEDSRLMSRNKTRPIPERDESNDE